VVESAADSDVRDEVETDSLLDSGAAVESLVDSGAADSLAACEVDSGVAWDGDSVVDSVAEALVAPVLPGVRTVLPSVARVLCCAAVTSYEIGAMWDIVYSPSSPEIVMSRIGGITVDLRPLGPDLQHWHVPQNQPCRCFGV
jgi:hypothetical protein